MHVPRTARFDSEATRYALAFNCDDCACFDSQRQRCRHRWPTEEHRSARYRAPLQEGDEVVFCKEFEVP